MKAVNRSNCIKLLNNTMGNLAVWKLRNRMKGTHPSGKMQRRAI